ncbi:hypothetical protein DCO48_16340 [Pseudomonas sp. SDI]|uniref:hypothetical protein n=1 Tax=Pseudomonas sp. SDI TaxID=2170734 RepID=UPI000DE5F112|nr:hypothetical protein [Pseudomonas sp. SDI]PWB31581.1 hypothetical protein DCO48_16340 [Pseudomonas sp. SDI]
MNRPSAATLQISSLHLRQALFLSLAVLLTLVGGQLHQAWKNAQIDSQLAAQAVQVSQLHAQVSTARNVGGVQAAPVTTTEFVATHEQRWVF